MGDGNNVLHALLLACAKVGVNVTAACPQGYEPRSAYVAEAQRIGAGETGTGAKIEIVTDPVEAVKDADIVYTDVWTSMGQEEETAQRLEIFAPYQVNSALLAHAKSDVIVLHCLPAHREEEITTEVMDAYKTDHSGSGRKPTPYAEGPRRADAGTLKLPGRRRCEQVFRRTELMWQRFTERSRQGGLLRSGRG